MKTILGYAIRTPFENGGDRYAFPGASNWQERPHLWTTKEAAKKEIDSRGITFAKIVRVVKKAPAPKFVIRKRHVVEYDTRELAEQVAETYAGGSLCWMVVPS